MKDENKQKFQAEAALLDQVELKARQTGLPPAQKTAAQFRPLGKMAAGDIKPQITISREVLVRLIDWIKEV